MGLVVLGLKYAAFLLTGSVALYSDALESIINVAAAVAALIAVRVSQIPADEDHPYGHSKAEYFSAVIEGVLIVLAAFSIIREAYLALLNPREVKLSEVALLVSVLASVINGVWASLLLRRGRLWRSPALIADGKHLFADVISSIGVLVGVVLAAITGLAFLDPILAILVALNILWSGYGLLRDSVGGLMDKAVPLETMQRIRETISANAQGALEAHDVRTRIAGHTTFIEFHLIVSGELSVLAAHDICDHLEQALKNEIAGAVITIHIEPENKAKHRGVIVI